MDMTNEEYGKLVSRRASRSPLIADMAKAFLVGGLICCAGQGLGALYGAAGLGERDAATAASVSLVFLAALLTGLGVYDDLAKFGGAGTLVPITGFSNAVVSPALEFKSEGYITGTAVKLFTIAGPVITYGISSSVLYGVIYLLCTARG